MKIKLALGVVMSLTAITLNTMPTGNDTKMRMENETIYEFNESSAKIIDEIEDEPAESNISISEESKAEIKLSKTPTKNPPKSKSSNPENHTENEPENANPYSNPLKDKAYVEGFGYVEVGGPTQVITGYSDGDINKMVGRMD